MTHTLKIIHTGTHNPSATPSASGYGVEIIRKRLADTEITPAGVRWDATCNCIQTFDGTTWTDAPGLDPRSNDGYRFPPRTGSDIACNAAENAVGKIEDAMGAILSTASVVEAGVLGIIDLLQPEFAVTGVGLLVDAILNLVDGFFVIGTATISASLTSTVYGQLKCIFFCNMDANGQVNAASLATITAEVNSQIGGVAALALNALLDVWGAVGLSNAGATGTLTGSCSGCDCSFCFTIDFSVSDGSAYGVILQVGTYVPGSGWIGIFGDANSNKAMALYWLFPETMTIVGYGTMFDKGCGAGGNDINTNRLFMIPGPGLVDIDAANPIGNGQTKFKSISPTTASEFDVSINAGSGGCDVTLRSMTIHYNRATPIWTPNC